MHLEQMKYASTDKDTSLEIHGMTGKCSWTLVAGPAAKDMGRRMEFARLSVAEQWLQVKVSDSRCQPLDPPRLLCSLESLMELQNYRRFQGLRKKMVERRDCLIGEATYF